MELSIVCAEGGYLVFDTMGTDMSLAFLSSGTRTGKLATATPSGRPHVTPVWFVVDGDEAVFTTRHDSVKGRNLRANPRAALTVDSEEYPYSFVIVRGRVRLQDDAPDLLAWTTRIAARYVPAALAADIGRRNAIPGEVLCLLRLDRIRGVHNVAA